MLSSQFVFERAPTRLSHASSVIDVPDGLLVAWYGGSGEGEPDASIWTARYDGARWAQPTSIVSCSNDYGPVACWNPVFGRADPGRLILFYKAGRRTQDWWGMMMYSEDEGRSWSAPVRLAAGIVGPTRSRPVRIADGSMLAGSSTELGGRQVHLEHSEDGGATWGRSSSLPDSSLAAIQPALLVWPDAPVQLLARSRSGYVVQSRSIGTWRDWQALSRTELPNPNSAVDAVLLQDGRALLVYNHSRWLRSPLNVAVSKDGQRWEAALVLEDGWGEFSYPSLVQSRDGRVHITYTWRRERIAHAIIDPGALRPRPFDGGEWPG